MDYPGGPNHYKDSYIFIKIQIKTTTLTKGRQEESERRQCSARSRGTERKRFADVVPLALKMEEGTSGS